MNTYSSVSDYGNSSLYFVIVINVRDEDDHRYTQAIDEYCTRAIQYKYKYNTYSLEAY